MTLLNHQQNNRHSTFNTRGSFACFMAMAFAVLLSVTLFALLSPAQASATQVAQIEPSTIVMSDVAWSQMVSGMTNLNCRTMVMNPITPSILFAATEYGDYRSTDGGSNWQRIRGNGSQYTWGTQFVVDASSPTTIYLADYSEGILKSTNSGNNWSAINGDLSSYFAPDTIASSPISPSVLFVGFTGDVNNHWGAHRTIDGGLHWEKITNLPDTGIEHFVFQPGNPNRLYAATWQGVYVSNDSGNTWDLAGGFNEDSYSVTISPISTTVIYVGAGDGVYKSVDGGTNWVKISSAGGSFVVVDPIEPGTLYVSYFNNTIRTKDYGVSWETIFQAQSSPFGVIVDRPDAKNG
ncbi:MAG: WD40/YVTN/BNR-like repeat-containing protein, partial [Anaerolineales bacterium]